MENPNWARATITLVIIDRIQARFNIERLGLVFERAVRPEYADLWLGRHHNVSGPREGRIVALISRHPSDRVRPCKNGLVPGTGGDVLPKRGFHRHLTVEKRSIDRATVRYDTIKIHRVIQEDYRYIFRGSRCSMG